MALSHLNLERYFDIMFHMIQVHSWNFSDIENMIPWERDIYLIKMNHWIEEENDKNKEFQRKQNG